MDLSIQSCGLRPDETAVRLEIGGGGAGGGEEEAKFWAIVPLNPQIQYHILQYMKMR